MFVFEYFTDEEFNEIIERETGKGRILTEVRNITEGNFVIFRESTEEETKIERLERELTETKVVVADINAAITEIILGGE